MAQIVKRNEFDEVQIKKYACVRALGANKEGPKRIENQDESNKKGRGGLAIF